jgi:hypothetical protein
VTIATPFVRFDVAAKCKTPPRLQRRKQPGISTPDAESRPTAPLPSRAPFSSSVAIKCPICAALHPLTAAMKLPGGLRLSGPTLSTISAKGTAVCRDANHATQPPRSASRLYAIEGCAWDRSFRLLTQTSYSHLTGQDLSVRNLSIAAASRIRLQHGHI